jgi:hypothetical protein
MLYNYACSSSPTTQVDYALGLAYTAPKHYKLYHAKMLENFYWTT